MNKTEISWTDLSWNPMSGCKKISDGCIFCYAHRLAENKRGTRAFPNGFDLTIRPHKLVEPRRVKEPSLIFVNSMSDPFADEIPNDYRHQIFDAMDETPRHTYQLLTKRSEAMAEFSHTRPFGPHIWAGVTLESAKYMHRIEDLVSTECHVRYLSIEPMLSPIPGLDLDQIDWVIVGGESGTHLADPKIAEARSLARKNGKWEPRPDRAGWVRGIRDQCAAAGVPFFFKQWGGVRPGSAGNKLDRLEWHQFPE